MIKRWLAAAALFLLFLGPPAHAQNSQCRTAPVGTSTANCASEAFVTESVAAGGTVKQVDTGGLATGGPITSTGTVTVTAATKTDEQAGTSTTTVVTPARQQSHDSAAKAWVSFTGSTGAVLASYGVSSMSRTGLGEYTINFSSAFASANYVCMVTPETNGNAPTGYMYTSVAKTASLVHIAFQNSSGSVFVDPTTGHMVCYGRQ